MTMPVCSIGTRVGMLGANAQDAARVDQWVHFAEHEIATPTYALVNIVYGFFGPFNREVRVIEGAVTELEVV